ncbi:CLUMA_CG001055, isoform A [Clunio marinus]|uniref:CLUMA_CG001055, isoform A n=1 Tax=Clunio marinus TaxID=568069 RepID=A0A1J1HGY3_9DIPT|nr:CLUMA_CG001055, isoform A [Clunio marinus]
MASSSAAKRSLEEGENSTSKYAKSGSSESFHGTCYHIKLMMLLIVRAYNEKREFEIACEWKQAGKLDDIVYKYFKLPNEKFILFLQAKHKKGNKEIEFKNLENGEYDLIKYFKSYKNIIQCSEFRNCEIQELVISTNLTLRNDLIRLCEDANDINDLRNDIKIHKLRNVDDYPNIENLVKIKTKLLEYDELRDIANELASKVGKKEKIAKNNELLHTFSKPLKKYVLDISGNVGKFRDDFITSENEVLMKLRDYFIEKAKLNDLNEIRFIIMNDFEKEEKCSCSNHEEEFPIPSSDETFLTKRTPLVEDFLKKFRFYLTPNEDKFENILKNELEKIDIFRNNKIKNIENVYCRFHKNILEWFKSVDNEGKAEKKNLKQIADFFEKLSAEC